MRLSDREWKKFKISDIFEIKNGFYNKKPPKEKKELYLLLVQRKIRMVLQSFIH